MLVMNWGGRTREVINFVGFDIERESHVMPHEFIAGVIMQMLDVALCAGKKIIRTDNLVSFSRDDRSNATLKIQRHQSPKYVYENRKDAPLAKLLVNESRSISPNSTCCNRPAGRHGNNIHQDGLFVLLARELVRSDPGFARLKDANNQAE